MLRFTLCCLVALSLALVAGCGGGGDSDSTSTAAGAKTTTPPTTPTTPTVRPIKDPIARPPSPGPHPGATVEQLIVRDVVKGHGPEIHAGDTGIFDFIGSNWDTGKQIESSWNRRRPFQTAIDKGVVIDGWWQGIPGMRVGGRRQILIPPSLGFANSINSAVKGRPTFFDVALLGVIPARPGGASSGAPQADFAGR